MSALTTTPPMPPILLGIRFFVQVVSLLKVWTNGATLHATLCATGLLHLASHNIAYNKKLSLLLQHANILKFQTHATAQNLELLTKHLSIA